MSDLAIEITGFVVGDDLEVRRAVTDLPAGIETAWLTLKHYPGQPDQEARLQKRITTTDVPGTGRVIEAGGTGTDGDLRFDLTPEDTMRLGPKRYVHDIQIKLTTGKVGEAPPTPDPPSTQTPPRSTDAHRAACRQGRSAP